LGTNQPANSDSQPNPKDQVEPVVGFDVSSLNCQVMTALAIAYTENPIGLPVIP
jgi:hypothetical protein